MGLAGGGGGVLEGGGGRMGGGVWMAPVGSLIFSCRSLLITLSQNNSSLLKIYIKDTEDNNDNGGNVDDNNDSKRSDH